MLNEIGGNFPITKEEILSDFSVNAKLYGFDCFEKKFFTFSGRTAITLLLENILINKNGLLPDYTCDSFIRPFVDKGFLLFFYYINENLSVVMDYIYAKLNDLDKIGGIVFLQSYYGFNT